MIVETVLPDGGIETTLTVDRVSAAALYASGHFSKGTPVKYEKPVQMIRHDDPGE
jgi:hypothetical protein